MSWLPWGRHRRAEPRPGLPAAKPVRWGRRRQRDAADLVADAEAFLNGHLVERGDFLGRYIPAWEWTNLLAHGTTQELEAESHGVWSRWDGTVAVQWRRARTFLAGEVLEYAQEHGSLAEVQTSVLVPLELDLASDPRVRLWLPTRWAQAVESALAEHNLGRFW
jgi:hypothetical protein